MFYLVVVAAANRKSDCVNAAFVKFSDLMNDLTRAEFAFPLTRYVFLISG